ncbi:MAG: hypothetical protein J7L15_08220 [Clostridiales bacterium]|nr:hypothetical protein [Clostridiales bacterium]
MGQYYSAKKLIYNIDMKCIYIDPRYEWWEGGIVYTFIPAFKVEGMMPQVYKDTDTLMIWISESHNVVVSSKARIDKFT